MAPDAPAPEYRPAPQSVEQLEEMLSRPTPEVADRLARLDGDLIILGAGGKMGPTLARMARRASDQAGVDRRVIGVSRFRDPTVRQRLEEAGVETIRCDLLEPSEVQGLPEAPNVVSMAGFKFGAGAAAAMTWAANCYSSALVARRFAKSRMAVFSTGNVYGMVPVDSRGSKETDPPAPVGEYAMSTLGRERIYEYFSRAMKTPVALLRLNYATELRYGVLVDIAQDVQHQRPVDVSMSRVNVIWLQDANAMALAALTVADSPPRIVNVAGAEILTVREVAEQFSRLLAKPVCFCGEEGPTAYLNDGRRGHQLLGAPQVDAEQMIRWTADWVGRGGENLGKPTHFQVRDGKY